MIQLGSTSDIIVAAFLILSQLIEPVPDSGVAIAEKTVQERQACQNLELQKKNYQEKKCERLKNVRAKYKVHCQQIENDMNAAEVQCATDPFVSQIVRFRPKPLQDYLKMPNDELVNELYVICSAFQDRALLEREQWQQGELSNRDELGTKLVVLTKPELQPLLNSILKEARDGQFLAQDAYKVITAICHWKVDRQALAAQVDFTSAYTYLKDLLNEIPNVNELPDLPQASFVFNSQNERIGEVFDREFINRNGERVLGRVNRRRLVSPEEIPRKMYEAFTAIEDKRFFAHNGFDFEAIKRLYYGGIQGGKQGGSTFTMQLVKNAFFDADVEQERAIRLRTLRRKLKELLMLPMVEGRYGKDEILAYYLNLIDLTPNAQGVKMAAMDLFGTEDLNSLSLAQIALMAALPKGISKYNPYRNPKEAKLRRDTVLTVMAEQGYITELEKTNAQSEPMHLVDRGESERKMALSRYFTSQLEQDFILQRSKNLTDPRWNLGGFDIRTSYRPDLQEALTRALQSGLMKYEKTRSRSTWKPWLNDETGLNVNIANSLKPDEDGFVPTISELLFSLRPGHPYPETGWQLAVKVPKVSQWQFEDGSLAPVQGKDQSIFKSLKNYDVVLLETQPDGTVLLGRAPTVQGAAVVMDVETGDILAMSGGFSAGPYGKFAQNNRAAVSLREPGSSIKPITYLYALQHGYQPNQLIPNSSVRFPKTTNCPYKWSPKNYKEGGSSQMTVRTALQKSVNKSLLNMFLGAAGVADTNKVSGDLSNASPEQKEKLNQALDEIYDLASQLGAYPERSELKKLRRDEPCFPFIIGGYETTALHLVQMYATIANGGLRREPVFLKEVMKDGEPILIDRSAQRWMELQNYRNSLKSGFARAPEAFAAVSKLNPVAVAQLRYMMQGIVKEGTAKRISRWSDLIGGKTGTTNDSRDVWFAGFNAKIAVVVWVGYDDKKVHSDLGNATGGSVALPIFEDFMESYYKIHPEGLLDPLPLPSTLPDVVAQLVDPDNGKIVQPNSKGQCPKNDRWLVEYFPKNLFKENEPNSCLVLSQ